MLNEKDIEFLENIVLINLEDEDNINRLKEIISKLKKRRESMNKTTKSYNARNKEYHSLLSRISYFRKKGDIDKVKELQEQANQIKEWNKGSVNINV